MSSERAAAARRGRVVLAALLLVVVGDSPTHGGLRLRTDASALLEKQPAAASALVRPPGDIDDSRSTLFVALDAVPYATAVAARDAGQLTGFHPPAPLISTFPSSTSVALGAILGDFGLERSPGYEARFFDWDRRRRVGGGPVSYFRIRFAWREFFDWNRKGPVRNLLQSARPLRSSVSELTGALAAFAAGDADEYWVYVAATDTAAHLGGPASLRKVFEELDGLLTGARGRRSRPFDTVLYSDHGIAGGAVLVNVRPAVEAALRAAGLRVRGRLRSERDVVLTPYGLVSSFELYAGEGDVARAGRAAAAAEGVDLCAWPDGEGWRVADGEGEATIERLGTGSGPRWVYRPTGSDPLEWGRQAAEHGTVGLADDAVLAASVGHPYPDAFHRIATSFRWVANAASIVCSTESTAMFGRRGTEWLARVGKGRLRWTHGALENRATLGFVTTDAAGWSGGSPVRAEEALTPLRRKAAGRGGLLQ